MSFNFTKIDLQILYYLLDSEFSDLVYESENDPLFFSSLKADRLSRVKILRDKVSMFIERSDEYWL